tara:strand:+ start:895 stop:2370 length:1476 start_codon:yes stop_codon:yes gene_type:complete
MALLTQTPQQYYNDPNSWGNYQFISLREIIDQFMVVYVGEEKIISKAKRLDVAFHAQRALAELSYDVFRSCKSHEILVPNTLCMTLPQDYVNYRKISWVDNAGIKHRIYPTNCSTNDPSSSPYQDDEGDFEFQVEATFTANQRYLYLDDLYPNLSGEIFIVTSPTLDLTNRTWYLTENSVTGGLTTQGGGPSTVSTISLSDTTDIATLTAGTQLTYISQVTQNEVLTIRRVDGSLMPRKEDGVKLAGGTITAYVDQFGATRTNKITFTGSVSSLSVGMSVWNSDASFGSVSFPQGTVIDQIDTTNNIVYLTGDYNIPAGTGLQGAGFTPTNGDFLFSGLNLDSRTLSNYQSSTTSENQHQYDDDTLWPLHGERYGIDPQFANINGTFNIDQCKGRICFSSNLSGRIVVLDYISDGLGTEEEMVVPKLGEEAMYKWILYAIISSRSNTPEYQVRRFKKEKFAEVRRAKIRISNLKLEEVTQVLRGKSKQIKH